MGAELMRLSGRLSLETLRFQVELAHNSQLATDAGESYGRKDKLHLM